MRERVLIERKKEVGSRRNIIVLEAERIAYGHGSLEGALSNRAQNMDLRALVRPLPRSKIDIILVYTSIKDTLFLLNNLGLGK